MNVHRKEEQQAEGNTIASWSARPMKAHACPAAAGPLRPAIERASYDCSCLGTAPVQLLVDVSVNPNAQTLSLPSPVVVDEAEAEARTANERDAHSNGCDGIEINCRRWAEERRMLACHSGCFFVARTKCGVALGSLRMVSDDRASPFHFFLIS